MHARQFVYSQLTDHLPLHTLNDATHCECLDLAMRQQEKLARQQANVTVMQALLNALIYRHVRVGKSIIEQIRGNLVIVMD